MKIDSIVIDIRNARPDVTLVGLSRMVRKRYIHEHQPCTGGMYVFIVFGRLGCKHVILLRVGYVLDVFGNCIQILM